MEFQMSNDEKMKKLSLLQIRTMALDFHVIIIFLQIDD